MEQRTGSTFITELERRFRTSAAAFHMWTSDVFLFFLVLWGNPLNDIKMEWEGQRELNVLLRSPQPPVEAS